MFCQLGLHHIYGFLKLPTHYLYSKCVIVPLQFARHILYEQFIMNWDVVGHRGIRKSKRLETTGLSRVCTQFTGAAEQMAGLPLSARHSFGWAAGSGRGRGGPVSPSLDSWVTLDCTLSAGICHHTVFKPTYVSMDFRDGSITYCSPTSSELTMYKIVTRR